ncbi:hypothetical protein MRX96_006493 [Rhipicephalus microplus]
MPILYTDGNSTDAGASTSQQRDGRSDKMKHSKKERHRPLRQSSCEVFQEKRQELEKCKSSFPSSKPRAPSRHHPCPRLTCVSAEDGASLNTQSLPPSTRPTVLECNQMQEIKIGKWSVSKNTTMSDLRTANVANLCLCKGRGIVEHSVIAAIDQACGVGVRPDARNQDWQEVGQQEYHIV